MIHNENTNVKNSKFIRQKCDENRRDPYLSEDPIILPGHLQCLVDNAMVNVTRN